MRRSEIAVGNTYHNRGKGRTKRTVLAISDKLEAPWFSTSDKPDEPVVLYKQDDTVDRLYIRSFAQWAGGRVLVTDEEAANRPRVDTSKYEAAYPHNWALLRLAKIGSKLRTNAALPVQPASTAALIQEWEELSKFMGQEFTPSEIAEWHDMRLLGRKPKR